MGLGVSIIVEACSSACPQEVVCCGPDMGVILRMPL